MVLTVLGYRCICWLQMQFKIFHMELVQQLEALLLTLYMFGSLLSANTVRVTVVKADVVRCCVQLRPFMCPYCQKTFKTCVNCKKHMKTHRQELALQLSHGASTVNTGNANLPASNGPAVDNAGNSVTYAQEVELIEVSCPADVHLNQALQATHLGVGNHPKTVLTPHYQQSAADTVNHQSNVVQQPAVIQDFRTAVVTDFQLQNVFNAQV